MDQTVLFLILIACVVVQAMFFVNHRYFLRGTLFSALTGAGCLAAIELFLPALGLTVCVPTLVEEAAGLVAVEAMGCEVVNTTMGCCGKNTPVAGPLMEEREAECAGADWIIVGCPMCQVKFDSHPDGMPAMHIAELVAMAAGDTESLRHHIIRRE